MPIDKLRRHLEESTTKLSAEKLSAEKIYGQKELELLRQKIAELQINFNVSELKPVPKDKMIETLTLLEKRGPEELSCKQLQCLCSSLTRKIERFPALIGTDKLFESVFARIEHLYEIDKLTVRAWRGLLSSYLSSYFDYAHSDNSEEKKNWLAIRVFLEKTFEDIYNKSVFRPLWMKTLKENKNLLTEKPCTKYALNVIEEDDGIIDSLKRNLCISEESWLWSSLILEQVIKATELGDDEFKIHIQSLIAEVKKHPLLVNKSLGKLLTRYADCSVQEVNESLKTFALEKWGTPFISRQELWGSVEPKVKQMVKSWLVFEDLKDFFELLIVDGVGDERRLKFWLKYLDQIEYARIALGDYAYYNKTRDYVELKRRKKDRFSRLVQPGIQKNNAFLMKIGQFVFVEFGVTGNACYGYEFNKIRFNMDAQNLSLLNLKDRNQRLFKGIHRDSSGENWEEKFDRALRNLGIFLEQTCDAHKKKNSVKQQESIQAEFNEKYFYSFVNTKKLYIEDKRNDGGYLWVRWTISEGQIAETLRGMGFKLRQDKGYWRK